MSLSCDKKERGMVGGYVSAGRRIFMNNKVTVLMSTYNGEKFIQEQLDSIFTQKLVDIVLVVRDDGSTDNTKKILIENQRQHTNMIIIDDGMNMGACKSFLGLINQNYDSDYFALADQDDIWDEDKLIVAINQIALEEPTLYFSNLRLVDSENNFIRNSHSNQQTNSRNYAFLSVPLPTGCTVVYNKALSNIVSKYPVENYSMHDTFLYNVACIFGKVIYDYEPHINYRLHGNNVVGALNFNCSMDGIKRELKYIFEKKRIRSVNAEILYNRYSEILCAEDLLKISKVINYRESFLATLRLLLDGDFKPDGLYRTIRFKIMVLLHTF